MSDKQQRRKKRKEKERRKQTIHELKVVEVQVQRALERYPLRTVQGKENPCGECQACCMAVGVHELEKPVWTTCQHQCAQGCGIYEQRPASCQSYYCLYQAGFLNGGAEMRPDKLGIILDLRGSGNKDVISAWEIREGAADTPQVLNLLREIGNHFVVLIRRYNSTRRRIIGPAHLVANITVTEHA